MHQEKTIVARYNNKDSKSDNEDSSYHPEEDTPEDEDDDSITYNTGQEHNLSIREEEEPYQEYDESDAPTQLIQ